jgi:DNA replication initiation complex subunit (GINS family)
MLDATRLFQLQWKEGVQVPGQISDLPGDFYPKLRRFIADLMEQTVKQPDAVKFQEYDRARQLARDIVNSRLKKIVALSAAPTQSDQVLKKFTSEERLVYDQLVKIISEWKTRILDGDK